MRSARSFVSIACILFMTLVGARSEPSINTSRSTPVIITAQAGSTGGTIGKEDKSISGRDETEKSGPREKNIKSPRDRVGAPTLVPGESNPKTFTNPTYKGIRVDGCLKWGPQGCGEPAASAWCRTKGFSRATDWKTEKIHPTIFIDPQSSVKICDLFFCGAFSQIVCE